MPKLKFSWGWIAFAAVWVFALFVGSLNDFYFDWLWFSQVEYLPLFQKMLAWEFVIGCCVALFFFILLALQVIVPRKYGSRKFSFVIEGLLEVRDADQYEPLAQLITWVGIIFISVVAGIGAAQFWMVPLQAIHATPFGTTDPVFGRDISFYIFQLPFYQWMTQLAIAGVFLSAVLAIVLSIFHGLITIGPKGVRVDRPAQIHLSILGGCAMLLMALGYRWSQFDLLQNNHELITGANFSDIHARLPVYGILFVLALIVSALFFITPFLRLRMQIALTGLSVWFAVSIVGLGLYPEALQRFTVLPNELKKETPYMLRHIQATRKAYKLDKVQEIEFPVSPGITATDIQQNPGTIQNIRLWDHRPLREAYKQLQEIRTYYDFVDVDVDRYTINGRYTQTMLAARELSTDRLPSRNWINEHFVFTHGYGVVMNPVNLIAAGGNPHLLIKDIPPVTPKGISLERPEIYFGELTNTPAFVRTTQQEFDYPAGDKNVYTTYSGRGGFPVGSLLRKTALAWRLGNAKILLSQDIRPDSRVMLYRNIRERAKKIAPFLSFDPDPYIVVADGRLFWIIDAYTRTSRYPYAHETEGIGNYIRNSVKVVVDAYNGTVQFYISDNSDPIIQTLGKIFPGTFQPLDRISPALRHHLRYPEGLFRIQAHIYKTFHMNTADVFYNKEDLWQIAKARGHNETQDIEPYYTVMKLPGERREEFVLMIPYTPAKKDNLIAWFSARSDGDRYGELLAYKFPKQELVYGPFQVEARIDQDAEISKQLSLWGQRGSQVIRGNLLVIPIGKSLLYVEPLYLQAEAGKLPELKRVIVASGDRLAMEDNFPQALQGILREKIQVADTSPGGSTEGGPRENISRQALDAYREAQQYRKEGDWAGFGRALARLENLLQQLAR